MSFNMIFCENSKIDFVKVKPASKDSSAKVKINNPNIKI